MLDPAEMTNDDLRYWTTVIARVSMTIDLVFY